MMFMTTGKVMQFVNKLANERWNQKIVKKVPLK